MNILLFAMTILMLLASMTYAKLDSFYSMQLSKSQFEYYLKKNESNYLKEKADKWYEKVIVKSQQPSNGKKKIKAGLAKLSFYSILDSKEREKDPAKAREIIEISKNLILNLFEDQPNVQKMLETNSDIVDRFFNGLIAAIDKLPEQSKIKKIDELSSLELQDEDLKNFRYEIFKRNDLPKKEDQTDLKKKKNEKTTYSLLDEWSATSGKTRLFLASKNLLKVIFKNEAAADQILEKRYSLFNAVKNKMDANDATIEFKHFLNDLCPYLNDSLFDYTVTQTNPKDYE
ncbi:MAG TPA: hypothetical protein PLC42_07905 [Parachlamydiaceae bacterium]|nr:hypothetical protein [Parachlamydiaceae bacterium]